jgi:hypothetical protein
MGGASVAAVMHHAAAINSIFQNGMCIPSANSRTFSCPAISGANHAHNKIDHRYARPTFFTCCHPLLMPRIV